MLEYLFGNLEIIYQWFVNKYDIVIIFIVSSNNIYEEINTCAIPEELIRIVII